MISSLDFRCQILSAGSRPSPVESCHFFVRKPNFGPPEGAMLITCAGDLGDLEQSLESGLSVSPR